MRHSLALATLTASVLSLAFFAYSPSAAQDAGWSTVKGKIVFIGAPPAPEKLAITKDQEHCLGKGDIYSDKLIVSKDGGVKNVFVWLAPEGKGKLTIHPDLATAKTDKIEMDQPRCAFVPHAVAMREGQTLLVKNSSTIPHNISYAGSPKTNPGANFLIPAGGSKDVTDLRADRLPINASCNIHPWMTGIIRVYDHPYFALTGDDGSFEMPKAPVGKCLLYVWHEESGWINQNGKTGQPIEVGANGLDLKELKFK